jgi:hypothetical protein
MRLRPARIDPSGIAGPLLCNDGSRLEITLSDRQGRDRRRGGRTIGNGRATSLLVARSGAIAVVADRDLDSATETVAMITFLRRVVVDQTIDIRFDDQQVEVIDPKGKLLAFGTHRS